MSRPAAIDIAPDELALVRQILAGVLPAGAAVWVYGSRARGTTRRGSDLDLAIDAGRPLTRRETTQLGVAFEESSLPYRVDLVDWQTLPPAFRQTISPDCLPLPPAP